jgi:hypothetical protein
LRRHINGESDSREDVEAPIMRDPVPEWERRILCTVERPRAAQISKKMQSARESVVTEFRWFAGRQWAANGPRAMGHLGPGFLMTGL